MRDELTYPYRVAILTLDAHAAAAVAQAETTLQPEFPGLTVEVHAAATWGEDPSALDAARAAVAGGARGLALSAATWARRCGPGDRRRVEPLGERREEREGDRRPL